MTDCRNGEIRDQLPDFVHDQLRGSTYAAVAAHVAGCAACAAEVALLRELRTTLRAAPAVDVGRIVAALPAPSRAGRAPAARGGWRRPDWRIAAAVVGLAVAAGSAAVLSGRLRGPDPGITPLVHQAPAESRPVQEVAAAAVSIDADLGEASLAELETLLEELESFDGLPAGEPEPPPALPARGEEGL